ncbi:MAG: hypothetical protein WBX11_06845 [Thiobacillaceae bacterium]|jgi:hypothetical protein
MPQSRFIEKAFDVANTNAGSVVPNAQTTLSIHMRADDWLNTGDVLYGFFKLLRGDIQ